MKTIELRIMGGLGNQLYQYATARSLQKQYNCPQIIIDTCEYDTYKIRNLELNRLLSNPKVSFVKRKGIVDSIVRTIYHIYQRLYYDIRKKHAKQTILAIGRKTYLLSTTGFKSPKGLTCDKLYLYGYFVSAQTAISIRNELMQEIKLNNNSGLLSDNYKMVKEAIGQKKTIGVSIRCAEDYVLNGWPVCSKDYYIEGIKFVLNNKQYKEYYIAIFADDIQKIKRERWFDLFDNIIYIENISVCESFELLRQCDDYVCSNSSFSWWGAFLTYANEPVIINPNRIFAGANEKDDEATFYDQMIILDYSSGSAINNR